MLKAIIVEDELPAQKVLTTLVEQFCPEVKIIACADSASEARKILKINEIDILFLDVNMPRESGFDLLKSINKDHFAIIFVTGNQEHALKALKASAVDFLLKPLDIDELKNAIEKASTLLQLRKQNYHLNKDYLETVSNLSENLISQKQITKLTLHHLQGFKIISISEIIYLEADGNYTIFNMLNREKIVVSKQLGSYEELLDSTYFFRTHKSFIINLKYLKEYSTVDGYFAILPDDISVLISRRRVDNFLQMVKKISLIN